MDKRPVSDAEARLRSVLESAPNMIITADAHGTIHFINRAIPPHRLEDVVGTSIYDYVPEADRARVRAAVAHVLASGELSSYEIHLPAAQGGQAFSVHLGPVRSEGAVTGVTLVTWDITAQRDLQARLMAADRLASVGLLAAGVAHEVNNPLTYALANLRWALGTIDRRSGPEATALSERLGFTLDGLERIAAIMRDLTSVARDDERSSIAVDINGVLDSSVRVAQHEIEKRARVVRDYGVLPPVRVPQSRVAQVFVNLIVNAAHAMDGVAGREHELRLVTRATSDGKIHVDFVDTGAGVAPELADRVFEPFVTTKPPEKGSGLGLYVCDRLVRSMDGRIEVLNTGADGTTFRVVLPASVIG